MPSPPCNIHMVPKGLWPTVCEILHYRSGITYNLLILLLLQIFLIFSNKHHIVPCTPRNAFHVTFFDHDCHARKC